MAYVVDITVHELLFVQVQADAVAALLLELAISGGDSSLMNTVRRSVCAAVLDMIDAVLKGQTAAGTNAYDHCFCLIAAYNLDMMLYLVCIY
jgi:hypothetical protein